MTPILASFYNGENSLNYQKTYIHPLVRFKRIVNRWGKNKGPLFLLVLSYDEISLFICFFSSIYLLFSLTCYSSFNNFFGLNELTSSISILSLPMWFKLYALNNCCRYIIYVYIIYVYIYMNTELSILYIIFQIQVMIIVERTFSFYGFIIVSFIRFIESLTSSSILSLIALFSLSNWKKF